MIHLDISVLELLGIMAVLFFAAVGIVFICFCVLIDAFHIRFPLPASALDEPEEAAAAPPVVHVGEVVLAPRQELLPPPAPSLDEVPIFAEIPFTLPMAQDFGFTWGPSWTASTGSYEVIAVRQAQPARARFATGQPKRKGGRRKVSVKVGEEVRSELVEAVAS